MTNAPNVFSGARIARLPQANPWTKPLGIISVLDIPGVFKYAFESSPFESPEQGDRMIWSLHIKK